MTTTSSLYTTTILNMSTSAPTNGAGDARDPSGFLSEIIGAPVTVKLNSGVVYKGTQPMHLKTAIMRTGAKNA